MSLSSVFFWASWDIEFPYPTKISMPTADFVMYRTQRKSNAVWFGKQVDDSACLLLVEKNKKPLHIFRCGYEDATEMMCVELHDTFEVPRQSELL